MGKEIKPVCAAWKEVEEQSDVFEQNGRVQSKGFDVHQNGRVCWAERKTRFSF